MSCCKCNRTGRCINCSCVKGGRACQGCLPQRLGNCANHANTTQVRIQLPLSAPDDKSAPTAQPLPLPPTSVPDRQPSNAYDGEDSHSPCPSAEQLPSNDSHHSIADTPWPVPPLQPPDFSWGPYQGADFCTLIDTAYEEVVHWRRNIFQVPSGSAGKAFCLGASSPIPGIC